MGVAISQWTADLWASRAWVHDRDASAIDDAFRKLRLSVERWPALADFVALLPGPKPQSHQPFPPISWERRPDNASPQAKAHATVACKLLGMQAPAWCLPESQQEAAEIARLMAAIPQPAAIA